MYFWNNLLAITKLLIFKFLIIEGYKLNKLDLSFPDDFLIGVASSAYQVEGAWNTSGKAESVWDYFAHNYPDKIADSSNGDVTCNAYEKYKEDIRLMKDMGVQHYRFSISWSRLLPNGTKDFINPDGLRYYHSIIDELKENGIEPFVTIYHWDHPQVLEEIGGWLNEEIIELFADYSRIVYQEFASKVNYFVTINEPYIYCVNGYRNPVFAPGKSEPFYGEYQCVQNMLKAHARAYHIYDEEFRSKHKGKISFVIPCFYYYSKNKNDTVSNDIAFEYMCGWQAHPVFSEEGDYPETMKRRILEVGIRESRSSSRFPILTKYWIDYIKGTADFFGLNHYTTYLVEPISSKGRTSENDDGLIHSQDENWPMTEADWFRMVPEGFGDLLRTIKRKYNNPEVFVMENGAPISNGLLDDERINFMYSYIKAMLVAMKRDNCNVKAYTAWSFLDSYEWNVGYTNHFGLVHVDFSDPERKRTRKKSSYWYEKLLKTRDLQPPFLNNVSC